MAPHYCFSQHRALSRIARLALALVLALAFAPASVAAGEVVCPAGCAYTKIQAALDAIPRIATITIGAGTYKENLFVDHAVTLAGAGQAATIIQPASSNPNCNNNGGPTLCQNASNMILVTADNVTIHDLTLDGDNPALHSGYLFGGADVDARNGIITNHLIKTFNNLSVHDVTVKNIYLHGIYASSSGTFAFDHNTVRNVQGDSASVAIRNFGGAGTISNNLVADAHDAIAATESRGTQFLNNTISGSATGIHSDDPGKNGGAADLIQGNQIGGCTVNGQGVRVLMPHIAPLVRQNRVTGCDVGLAAYGQGKRVAASFVANEVDAAGRTDSVGVFMSTNQLGAGSGNVNATLSNNSFTNVSTTLSLEAQLGFTLTLTATQNAFHASAQKGIAKGGIGGNGAYVVTATGNWWGGPSGPTAPDNLGGAGVSIPAGIGFSPWICVGADTSSAIGFQPDATALCNATPPDTQISEQPANPNTSRTIRFGFAGSDDITPAGKLSFECKADAGEFQPCSSPTSYTTLGVGAHTFTVRAKDPAGKLDPTPATYTWTQAVPPLRFIHLPLVRK